MVIRRRSIFPLRAGLRQGRSALGFCRSSSGPGAGGRRCRTRRRNAHRTGEAEEREVLYRWHPWSGRVVHVHEVVEKKPARCCAAANAVRGGGWSFRPGCSIGFHALPCGSRNAHASTSARFRRLGRSSRAAGRPPSSHAPVSGAAWEPLQPESGRHPCHRLRHRAPSGRPSVRSLRSFAASCDRPGPAWSLLPERRAAR